MSLDASRELTPADLRVLAPDLFGAVALVLHGREPCQLVGVLRPQPATCNSLAATIRKSTASPGS